MTVRLDMASTRLGSGRYFLRPALPLTDSRTVQLDLRPVDAEEWEKSAGGGVPKHLADSILNALECWTICDYLGNAHIIFGITDQPGEFKSIWLLGTEEGARECSWIWYELKSNGWIDEFFARWPKTECWSLDTNVLHHTWLHWVGFHWADAKCPFIQFRRDAANGA